MHQSPLLYGDGVRSHGMRGAGTLPIWEARFGATERVAAPKPTLAGRQGPVLQDM
jgi:hypothetical protein